MRIWMKNKKVWGLMRDGCKAQRERKRDNRLTVEGWPGLSDDAIRKGLAAGQPKETIIPADQIVPLIRKIANNVWKLRCKMLDEDGTTPRGQFDRVYRFVEALDDALRDIDVSIRSHNGESYETGMAVTVVAWEKREGAPREEIIETLKPTIRMGNLLLQQADVIVVDPAKAAPTHSAPGTANLENLTKENNHGSTDNRLRH